eukprot:8578806-Ditylum_brightwellii.AAC.1
MSPSSSSLVSSEENSRVVTSVTTVSYAQVRKEPQSFSASCASSSAAVAQCPSSSLSDSSSLSSSSRTLTTVPIKSSSSSATVNNKSTKNTTAAASPSSTSSSSTSQPSPVTHAVAGSIGSALAILLFFPLERARIEMQSSSSNVKNSGRLAALKEGKQDGEKKDTSSNENNAGGRDSYNQKQEEIKTSLAIPPNDTASDGGSSSYELI